MNKEIEKYTDVLEKLTKLKDEGILTKEEYNDKVACLLDKYKVNTQEEVGNNIAQEVITEEKNEQEKHLKNNKFFKIGIVLLSIIILSSSIYYFNKVHSYKNLINQANQYIEQGNYDKARIAFNKSLEYKKDPNVEKSIILVNQLQESQKNYYDGMKKIDEKDYLGAIKKLNLVSKLDEKYYGEAQKKIESSKKCYIDEQLSVAKDKYRNNEFTEAIKYLDSILKIDPNYMEANQLKETYIKQIKKEEDKKKLEAKKKVKKIEIKYSIDENGFIYCDYPSGTTLQLKIGDIISLKRTNTGSKERLLADEPVLKWRGNDLIAANKGGGQINIIPNGYDWDTAFIYYVVVN